MFQKVFSLRKNSILNLQIVFFSSSIPKAPFSVQGEVLLNFKRWLWSCSYRTSETIVGVSRCSKTKNYFLLVQIVLLSVTTNSKPNTVVTWYLANVDGIAEIVSWVSNLGLFWKLRPWIYDLDLSFLAPFNRTHEQTAWRLIKPINCVVRNYKFYIQIRWMSFIHSHFFRKNVKCFPLLKCQ